MRCLCPRCCNACLLVRVCYCDVFGLAYVYFEQCDEPLSLFVLSVCAYGGVVGYFRSFSFLCEFCFLYCDGVRLGAVLGCLVPRFCF